MKTLVDVYERNGRRVEVYNVDWTKDFFVKVDDAAFWRAFKTKFSALRSVARYLKKGY